VAKHPPKQSASHKLMVLGGLSGEQTAHENGAKVRRDRGGVLGRPPRALREETLSG
jgi:hypothetical protein